MNNLRIIVTCNYDSVHSKETDMFKFNQTVKQMSTKKICLELDVKEKLNLINDSEKISDSEEQMHSSLCSFSVEDNRPEVVPSITPENQNHTCSRPAVLQRGFNSIHGCNGGDGGKWRGWGKLH